MKKSSALLLVAGILGGTMVACTPKPAAAQPVAEDFLAALSEQDLDTALEHVDTAGTARQALENTFNGLQAEGLHAEISEVTSRENIARASYTLRWDLPRERELEYQAEMVLTRSEGEWTIRWQPSLVHPKLAANQHLELRSVKAQPASVVTSDGAEILSPGVVHRILVDTTKVTDPRRTATRIAGAVNAVHQRDETVRELDAAELADTLADASGSYSVMTIPQNQGALVDRELADLPEVRLNEEAAMVSNEIGFARDIMARVGNIISDDLEGVDGWRVSTVTQEGATFEDVAYEAPQLAPAVTIGLDRDIQLAAEEAVNLRQDMKAMLVAIRPSTGQVLAVAQTEKADEDGNVALMGQYPPGSTFKIVTAASGIQHHNLTPDSIVPCPGAMDIYGRTVINYNMFALGNVPMDRAFASSCNTTFADISTKLDPGQLLDTGKQFGLGIDYNIPGLDTVTGSIPVGETPLDRTEAGYGQGLDLASPFGMALVSATVAHGSTPVPSLIDGHVTEVSEEVPAPSPEVIEDLRRVMRSVVTSGTAAGMQASGEIYAKTGEAEINEGSHAWFTGYRDDDIAFATLVVLGGGSETATAITDRFFLNLDAARAARQPGAGSAEPAVEPAAVG